MAGLMPCRLVQLSCLPRSIFQAPVIFRRHRTGHSKQRQPKRGSFEKRKYEVQKVEKSPRPIDPNNIPSFVEEDIARWARTRRDVHTRLASFGIPPSDVKPLLDRFVIEVKNGRLSSPKAAEKYGLIRFAQNITQDTYFSDLDVMYSTIFFAWASDPLSQSTLKAVVSKDTLSTIQRLAQAADRYWPEEEYPEARKMSRKVILHVGPTNSGKTHQALRALAAAPTGVYAGPLRLLAHEIWERLNLGQIVPLGTEDDGETVVETKIASPLPDSESAFDRSTSAVVRKHGNPKYIRQCNLITGEEHRIVDMHASLVSCTVEMVSTSFVVDVAVIDEIQMIADEQRGNAWTNAVLGVCAREVHLCGEETAVPLIQALLKDTGDELVVKRYKRLTPLIVEKQSLNGDFSLVRKGDCIVTFRRSSIFAIQRQVEERTGMRCAVVYGKLPPELRSEQAALFNDPDSGYDVIIGSDSIGMGLNLKIRRIIFEAVTKFNGGSDRSLSVSQVKQIAGRAGRYGLHGDSQTGGLVTTLHSDDLRYVRNTIDLAPEPLKFARLGPTKQTFIDIAAVLPPGSTTKALFDAHVYISRLQPSYRYSTTGAKELASMGEFIDKYARGLTLSDRLQLCQAPIPWRDESCLRIVEKFIQMYRDDMHVDIMKGFYGSDHLRTLLRIEESIKAGDQPKANGWALEKLEVLHKAVVVYLWMSHRNQVVFSCREEARELKTRVETALEWALHGMSIKGKTDNPHLTWEEVSLRNQRKEIVYESRIEVRARRTVKI